MVKYACKVTSSECLSQSFTAVHEEIPTCMPEEPLHLEPVKLDIRGFESRRALKACRQVALEDLSFGTQQKRYTKSCARTFLFRHSLSFGKARSALVHLAEQCKSEPCLRMDTVLSQTVPKDFFPHCAGGTQIFSRCFCMDDSEATLLPLRRITYYENNDYQ